jgi:hypothetical protein
MTTGGFVGFVVNDTEKVFSSYGSAYPSEVGSAVLDWLTSNREGLLHPVPGGVRDQIRALRVLDGDTEPSPAEIERIQGLLHELPAFADSPAFIDNASEEELLEFATLDLDTVLQAGIAWDRADLPLDSVSCEWGYLIDLDTATFEVYRGHQHAPHTAGRFAQRPSVNPWYHPVALVGSWPLANLPDRLGFLARLDAY